MSLLTATPEEKLAKKNKSFDEFMTKPETKLIVSMIPPAQTPEALTTLLRAAFDAGSSHGSGEIVVEMLGAILNGPKGKGEKPPY